MNKIILYLCLFLVIISVSNAAQISGTIYDNSLQKRDNVILNINSLDSHSFPKQTLVSKTGNYLFDVPSGTYTITANYYGYSKTLSTKKSITITEDNGEYNLDLILFPINEKGNYILYVKPSFTKDYFEYFITLYLYWIIGAIGIFIVILIYFTIYFIKKRKKNKEKKIKKKEIEKTKEKKKVRSKGAVKKAKEKKAIKKGEEPKIEIKVHDVEVPPTEITLNPVELNVKQEKVKENVNEENDIKIEKRQTIVHKLDEELQQVYKIILEEGGRTTQKEIRKQIPLSEAKISLMISELEEKGYIEKIKKGRGNIIILKQN